MVEEFLSLRQARVEKVIERSRFITYTLSIVGEDEAEEALRQIRINHKDCTHVCYAYIADELGNCQRFSDDGEPQGTAGAPILEVVKTGKYRRSLIAVVRYFGGIKLGSGGLTRAYSSCASEAVAISGADKYVLSDTFITKLDYASYNKIGKILSNTLCKRIKMEYNDNVILTLASPMLDSLKEQILAASSGKAQFQLIDSGYINYGDT